MSDADLLFWFKVLVGIQVSLISIGMIFILSALQSIERNTRPPKPDIKSFINRNTKGDK